MPSSYNSTKASRSAFWLIAIQAFSIAFALPTNRTIDDTYGDSETGQLVFYSEAGWNTGQLCTGCGVQPDASQVYDRTWHDTTSSPVTGSHSATLTFFGPCSVFPFHATDRLIGPRSRNRYMGILHTREFGQERRYYIY